MSAKSQIQIHVVPSADGKSLLTGYLWLPSADRPTKKPAIVMMHGRRGAYSLRADGFYSAQTLSARHRIWGQFWSDQGCAALMVDGFACRGYTAGFDYGDYDRRPPEVSEKTVRPLDAYGALAWLRGRPDIDPDRIGLQGWSNGGMAALWSMSTHRLLDRAMTASEGFRAAIALYPGCKRLAKEEPGYRPYAPTLLVLAGDDEEVPPEACQDFAAAVAGRGAPLELLLYPKAHHNFDDPTSTNADDHAAAAEVFEAAKGFFGAALSA